jgi:hypothetical protein
MHLKRAVLLPAGLALIVQADDGQRMFMRVVVKNEIIVDATMESARAIIDAAKRDGKKMCQKYAQADGVVGASTEAYDETIRRCEECMGFDVIDEEMIDADRCGCNKPKPKSMESESYGMYRCGCNKPKPKSADCDDTMRCGCSKPKPKSTMMMEDRCGCGKPKPKDVERCSECGSPDPKDNKCGCNKPKPKSTECDDAMRCGCNKPKPKGSEVIERCGCSKPKPKSSEMVDRCGCSKPKPKTSKTTECVENCNKELCNC